MAITITPNIQATSPAASSAPASGIVLQAGQVITAQVLQILGNDQVQIAIGNQTIEAATQVPLQVGQTLQLQVSQTAGGNIGLAIVNQPGAATTGQAGASGPSTSNPIITLSPSLAASIAANLTPDAVTPASPLTQLETLAVSIAAQTAATQQTSLAPLFADLNVASSLPNLPPQVGQAVVQVLAQQTPLTQNLTANAVQEAFQSSGLFLETSLASGSAPLSNGVPDLKAALIVLRQALTVSLADVSAPATTVAPASTSTPQSSAQQAAVAGEETIPSAALPSDPAATAGSISTSASATTTQQGTVLAPAASALTEQAAVESSAVVATILAEGQGQLLESLAGAPGLVPPTATVTASPQNAAPATLADVLELATGGQNLTAAAVPADAARARLTTRNSLAPICRRHRSTARCPRRSP
jgi:hypothetical protein